MHERKKILITPENMRKLEMYAMDELGVSELTLMENAAHGLACELVGIINKCDKRKVNLVMLAGVGNNGGDVLAAAHILLTGTHGEITRKKINVSICVVGECERFSSAAKHNFDRLCKLKSEVDENSFNLMVLSEMQSNELYRMLSSCDVIIDGIFGIGLSRPAEKQHKTAINLVNQVSRENSEIIVVAVDVPSGLDADSGCVLETAINADMTVTMQVAKSGMLMNDGPDVVGEVKTVSIFEPYCDKKVAYDDCLAKFYDVETNPYSDDLYERFLFRKKNSNKGTYGKVLCICGSDEMRGAAAFVTKAAFAIGSGLVYVATIRPVWDSCSVICPEAVGMLLKGNSLGGIDGFNEDNLYRIQQKLSEVDVVLIGPGMMNDAEGHTNNLVKFVLDNSPVPVLIDADGLNATVEINDYSSYNCPVVMITPHPGEMSRILGKSIDEVQRKRIEVVRRYSQSSSAVTLLKGCGTVVVDGEKTYINTTGGSALAVAGSGDLLAGMIVGLVAQYLKLNQKRYNEDNTQKSMREIAYEAMKTATYLHGMLGDEAEKDATIGNISSVPLKLIDKLSFVLESEKKNVSNKKKRDD